jgi:hypothetical protein
VSATNAASTTTSGSYTIIRWDTTGTYTLA